MTSSLFPGQSNTTAIWDPPQFILIYTYKLIFSRQKLFHFLLKFYFHSTFFTEFYVNVIHFMPKILSLIIHIYLHQKYVYNLNLILYILIWR